MRGLWAKELESRWIELVHRRTSRINRPKVVLTSGLGGCTTCGAPIRFEEGATHTSCAYCGATALSTPDMHRRFLQMASTRLGGALTDRERAILANFDSAESVRVRGMKIPIAPITVAFSLTAAFAMTGGFIVAAMRGARVSDGTTPTGWIGPTLLVACVGLVCWGVLGVKRGIAGRKRFEQALGRAMAVATFAAPGTPRAPGRG